MLCNDCDSLESQRLIEYLGIQFSDWKYSTSKKKGLE